MANNTISQIQINGTTYDLLDAATRSTVSQLDQRVSTLEDSVGKLRLSQSVNSKAVDFEIYATENNYVALIVKMASGKSYVLHINSEAGKFMFASRNSAMVDTEIWHV